MTDKPPGTLVGTVSSTFALRKRGLILVLDLAAPEVYLKLGDEIDIRFPDGRSSRSHIAGVELCVPDPRQSAALLPREFDAAAIPEGTAVWKVQ